jgi:hypothetical protein
MWKNAVDPDRSQKTIWRMRIAGWIPKATDTHSEYVTPIVFLLQQCLHERASKLRHTHIGCLVTINPLTQEINPSSQRYLTRIFYWGFCFLNRAFRLYMRENPTNTTIIHSVY